jgi:hypothetical protein
MHKKVKTFSRADSTTQYFILENLTHPQKTQRPALRFFSESPHES